MNVLSLFDGLSGGRIALERANLKIDNYYSSEIDKYVIQIANKNYPQDEMSRLGDITKWQDWNIDWSSIDLVTGGFPCQAWSIAGKQLGDKDERGMLFWTMLDIMKKVIEYNPKAKFLIENVRMKKEFEEYITLHTSNALGVAYKHLINSALVSAQNRQRYYWTNIELIEDIKDKGILLKDILEDNASNLRPCELREFKIDSICHHIADATDIKGNESIKRVYADSGKSPTLTTMTGGHREPKVLIVPEATKKGYVEIQPGECVDLTFINSKTRRGRSMREKSNCLTATTYDYNFWNGYSYRKLTPLECERLQTLPDFFTSKGLDIHSQTLYNGNECNTKEVKCQKPVESKNVISLSQVGKLNSAINTILGSLDMEQLKPLENLSIKAKSVLSMGAKENSKQLKVCASSIINLGKENSLLMEAKNVRYAISQSEVGQMECVLSIISNNKETETLYRTKLENMSLSEMGENTIKTKMVDGLIGELQKKLLEENSEKEKLYIILTLINSIIALAILKSSQTQSISLCIDSLNLLQGNLLEMDLLSLKTENIVDVSNSSRYKMIGNGWTVDVIAHIFKGIGE